MAFAICSASPLLFMSTTNLSANPGSSGQPDYFVYVGTYGKGVEGFRFNAGTGQLSPLGLVGEVVNPSFLTTDRDFKHLYAVSELEGNVAGGVASFAIDRSKGKLTLLNSVGSGGEAPCHLSVDHSGRMLIVANYVTGGVSAFPIKHDGKLGEMSALMTAQGSGPNKERQDGPHAHEAVIAHDNKRVYVPDLGLDEIRIYKIEPSTGKLIPNHPATIKVEPGHGPRHIAFDAKSQYAYVINELKPLVTVFSVNEADGSLNQIENVPTLPADFKKDTTGAEIRIAPSGKFLYTTNRGSDTIQVFSIDPNHGTLKQVQSVPAQGEFPRGFALDPAGNFLILGNQKSNNLLVFKIDEKSGMLTYNGQTLQVPSPVDVLFVPAA